MLSFLWTLWTEPRPDDPPPLAWYDWAVLVIFLPTMVVEAVVRSDLDFRYPSLLIGVIVVVATLWRRRRPLLTMGVALAVMAVAELIGLASGVRWEGLYSMAVILILPYAIGRWGAGWEIEVGVVLMVAQYGFANAIHWSGAGDLIGGGIVFFFPLVLGVAFRYRHHNRLREMDQVKMREREVLARELHDTVAHHVSAIAIQAQAGLAVARTRPDAAIEALTVVEDEAARTLAEMRAMIGALRQGEEAELTPQRGVTDIPLLARGRTDGRTQDVTIDVEMTGDLDRLTPSVDAALYRLAQESITNAVRHARRVGRIEVTLSGRADDVQLVVADDGDVSALGPTTAGYGLVGMAERAKLLGGTFIAGPRPGRGWSVEAVLPRSSVER